MATLANGLELLESDAFDSVQYPYASEQYPGFVNCVLTTKADRDQLWVTFDEAYDRLKSFGLSEDFLDQADAFIDERVQQAVIKGRKIFFKIQEINSLVVSYLLKKRVSSEQSSNEQPKADSVQPSLMIEDSPQPEDSQSQPEPKADTSQTEQTKVTESNGLVTTEMDSYQA